MLPWILCLVYGGHVTLYEDDGTTYAYERGASSRIPMHWDDRSRTLTIGGRKGNFTGMPKARRITVVLPNILERSILYTEAELQINLGPS